MFYSSPCIFPKLFVLTFIFYNRTTSLATVLNGHIAANITVSEDLRDQQRIPVCRKSIWPNTVRCLDTPTFVYNCGLNIVFVDEGAVDCGGPSRYVLKIQKRMFDIYYVPSIF